MGYISKEFDGMIVDGFEIIPTGYKIIIKKWIKEMNYKKKR
jgi:hypothetical protein